MLYSDPNLTIVEAPVLQPSEIAIDESQVNVMNQELQEAAQMELPVDENEDF